MSIVKTSPLTNVTVRVHTALTVGPSLSKQTTVLIPSATSEADAVAQALALVPGSTAGKGTKIHYPILCVAY